jgi:apolipoprotein N-acyltransferase
LCFLEIKSGSEAFLKSSDSPENSTILVMVASKICYCMYLCSLLLIATVNRLKPYLIAAVAGALGGFSFPPMKIGVLVILAFAVLIVLTEQQRERKSYNLLLYAFFFCFHGAANWWVMSWQKETDPYLMAAGAGLWLGHPFFLMPAFWLYRYIRRRASLVASLAALPFLWTAIEWLHSLSDASYPWLALGYTQSYNAILIQIADITGVWGVSFFIISFSCFVSYAFLLRGRVPRIALSYFLFPTIVLAYGYYSISMYESPANQRAVVFSVVQPNINPWKKWNDGVFGMIELHQHLQDSLNALQHCDLSVWSETAIPIPLRSPQSKYTSKLIKDWVDSSHTALLTGYADYEFFPSENAPANAQDYPSDPRMKMRVFNAAGLFAPGVQTVPTHHKSKLTPFGEYMPFSDDFPFIQTWLRWGVGISGWNKGGGATVLPFVRGNDTLAKIGPVICIESIYPSHVADYARRGANVLAVITNDAWYDGTFGPEQHYCISRMRAVETRRTIVRCGNSGVSGFISPSGKSLYQAEPQQTLAAAQIVQLASLAVLCCYFGIFFKSPV